DGAADRAGEDARLQARDAHVAVELRAPRLLVGRDAEAKLAAADRVLRGGAPAAAPQREVVRNPPRTVQRVAPEGVLELELVRHRARQGAPSRRNSARQRRIDGCSSSGISSIRTTVSGPDA